MTSIEVAMATIRGNIRELKLIEQKLMAELPVNRPAKKSSGWMPPHPVTGKIHNVIYLEDWRGT